MHCKYTNINIPRFIATTLAGFAFIFASDFLIHGQLLVPLYEQTPQLWRSEESMKWGWMLGGQFLLAFITVFIFTRNFESRGLTEGARYGTMLGALMAVLMSVSYAWMPISLALGLSWAAFGFVQGFALGILFSLIYKK